MLCTLQYIDIDNPERAQRLARLALDKHQGARALGDLRDLAFHRPGPSGQADKRLFEKPGLPTPIAHSRQWLQTGTLALGEPQFDAPAGMMIPSAGVSKDEIRAFAMADTAVKSGLLRAEIRPCLIRMRP
ncbi:hypothetical protein [Roseateles sp.]|uniref:hypothetical protein n=1 Tax=Roseateles sp. TaxID=1971397 RepID=UPI003BA7F02A